jgi:hypothetical protein
MVSESFRKGSKSLRGLESGCINKPAPWLVISRDAGTDSGKIETGL